MEIIDNIEALDQLVRVRRRCSHRKLLAFGKDVWSYHVRRRCLEGFFCELFSMFLTEQWRARVGGQCAVVLKKNQDPI